MMSDNIRDLINALELPEGRPQLPPHLCGHMHDAEILRGTLRYVNESELHRLPEGWRVVPSTRIDRPRWLPLVLLPVAVVAVVWRWVR